MNRWRWCVAAFTLLGCGTPAEVRLRFADTTDDVASLDAEDAALDVSTDSTVDVIDAASDLVADLGGDTADAGSALDAGSGDVAEGDVDVALVDGGAEDAGPGDAAGIDVVLDDGPVDAGAVDVGLVDVGADVGAHDVSAADTGSLDAGAPDVSVDGGIDVPITCGAASVSCLGRCEGVDFMPISFAGGSELQGYEVVDVTGDGIADVVLVHQAGSSVFVYPGDGRGGFGARVEISTGRNHGELAVGDFNGDGRADVVLSQPDSGQLRLLLGTSGGLVAGPSISQTGSPRNVAATDVNGDGRLDLVLYLGASGCFVTRLGDGTGGFASAGSCVLSGGGLYKAAVTPFDWDGDGRDEWVETFTNTALRVHRVNGASSVTLLASVPIAAGPSGSGEWRRANLVDVNGDRRRDLVLTHHPSNGRATVVVPSGTSMTEACSVPVYGLTGLGWAGASYPVDVDGDGAIDWLYRAASSGGPLYVARQTPTCPVGYLLCGGACVDTRVDDANCGACGRACSAGMACGGGVCACAVGTLCGGRCVRTESDATNCGGCGVVCSGVNGSPRCAASRCAIDCATGFGDCDGDAASGCETTLATSAAHCGACGRACSAGQRCEAGSCSGGGAEFVIVGHGADTNPKLFAVSTTDASAGAWTVGTIGPPSDASRIASRFRYLMRRYILAASDNRVWTSTDGRVWSPSAALTHPAVDFVGGADGIVALSGDTRASITRDGAAWSPITLPVSANTGARFGGTWIVAGGGATVATSTDGTTWVARASGTTTSQVSALVRCPSDGPVYLFKYGGIASPSAASSMNGSDWSPLTQSGQGYLMEFNEAVDCLNGVLSYIGVNPGYATTQRYSTDGASWTHYQTRSGYDQSYPYDARSQTWDSVANVYVSVSGVPSEYNATAANSYHRATVVGGGWTLQTIPGGRFSARFNGMIGVASRNAAR